MGRLPWAVTAASASTSATLIRADEKRKAEEQFEAKLLEGMSSAESELTPADWSAIRQEALAKVAARKKPR